MSHIPHGMPAEHESVALRFMHLTLPRHAAMPFTSSSQRSQASERRFELSGQVIKPSLSGARERATRKHFGERWFTQTRDTLLMTSVCVEAAQDQCPPPSCNPLSTPQLPKAPHPLKRLQASGCKRLQSTEVKGTSRRAYM
ncbi:unnamed protein product [Pleuronectes platessa]|uniref:Uncharacterized protein n=1 Tax=Pleuronectes platessa TaxID=8262 RepID=A0A9N7UTZ9_PLEPL|nr:unnamed protein product [Pleuronectes platessa]